MDDFWTEIQKEAGRPPTPPVNTRPDMSRLQTAAQTATLLARVLQGPWGGRDHRAFQTIFQMMDDFRSIDPGLQAGLIEEPAELTGDARFDAFLAAAVEHLAFHASLPIPRWAARRDDLLTRFWFPSPFRSTRLQAFAESPAAFRRRGIFIDPGDLHRV